jgi:hypothetical protein
MYIGPTSFFADQTVSSCVDHGADRRQLRDRSRWTLLKAQRLPVRIRFASSLEVELAVQVQIEIGIEPYPTVECLDLL